MLEGDTCLGKTEQRKEGQEYLGGTSAVHQIQLVLLP
jgi:hypothetical protein